MDREKVMTWLEICGKNNDCSGCCPYSENGFGEYGQCRESLMADAYALLKEQEAQSVIVREKPKNGNILWFADCPKCKHGIERDKHKRFCGYCGQAVKWG